MRGRQYHPVTHPALILIATFNARISTNAIPKNVTKTKTGTMNSLF